MVWHYLLRLCLLLLFEFRLRIFECPEKYVKVTTMQLKLFKWRTVATPLSVSPSDFALPGSFAPTATVVPSQSPIVSIPLVLVPPSFRLLLVFCLVLWLLLPYLQPTDVYKLKQLLIIENRKNAWDYKFNSILITLSTVFMINPWLNQNIIFFNHIPIEKRK